MISNLYTPENRKNREKFRVIFLIGGIFLLSYYFVPSAYAYIDPGSGSIVFQVIIGILVGIGITVKMYWAKLKYLLSSRFSKKTVND